MEVSSELAQKLDLAKYNFIRDRKIGRAHV